MSSEGIAMPPEETNKATTMDVKEMEDYGTNDETKINAHQEIQ